MTSDLSGFDTVRQQLRGDFRPPPRGQPGEINLAIIQCTRVGRKCIKLSGKKIEILLLNSQWTGDQHLIVRSREKMRFLENDLLTFL